MYSSYLRSNRSCCGNSKTEERIRKLGSRSRVGGTGHPLER
jgi:hypothetical protein